MSDMAVRRIKMRLYDTGGNRLYCVPGEVDDFLARAYLQKPIVRTFAETLAHTGCRISEALEISPKRVELPNHGAGQGKLIFRTLKKRQDDVYRAVPVPPDYIDTLNAVHGIREAQKAKNKASGRLWPWTRQHAYEIIKKLMIEADITEGPHQCPKGLRHAFGIDCTISQVPLPTIQKWMGHAQITTTAIYLDAVGEEEANHAAKRWERREQRRRSV